MARRKRSDHHQKLQRLFRRKPVVDIDTLRRTLGTESRITVFRALRPVGYLTSYSHAGRYYTLRSIPTFDNRGLWFHGEIRFSAHGTLRATVVVLVEQAPTGHTHEELEVILGLRVHDTLRSLVQAKQIGRERVDTLFVYVDADSKRARAQLERRREAAGAGDAPTPASPESSPPLDLARVVDVLLAVIHAPADSPRKIAARLRARGLSIDEDHVQTVFRHYGLEKKTARSRSRLSRR